MKGTRVLKNILFAFIIITIFFTSIEIVQRVRYALRYKNAYWLRFGFMDKPKKYEKMMNPGMKTIDVAYIQYDGYIKNNPAYTKYNINRHGFRGEDFELEKEKGAYRVVALGGSTTFCTYVEDDDTYPEYLQKLTDGEVINGGVPSINIWEIRHLFEKEIIDMKPDVVLLSSVFNNLFYYAPHCLYRTGGLVNSINKFLLRWSLFYVTLREKLSLIMHGDSTYVWFPPLNNVSLSLMKYETFWKRFKNEYGVIARGAKENAIKLVIIRQPILLRPGYGILFDESMAPVYEKIYDYFDSLGVQVIDAAAKFNQHPDRETLFVDDGLHLTAKGNEYLASIIADELWCVEQ